MNLQRLFSSTIFRLGGGGLLSSPSSSVNSVVPVRFLRHGIKVDFSIKRERPLGPRKILAPGVKVTKNMHQGKYQGLTEPRIGEIANYRRIILYPEDGRYTIGKLPIRKLAGRHPVTGRKVCEGIGGGSKQKARWIDDHRFPRDWPKGTPFIEKIISVNYNPLAKAKIALTAFGKQMRWIVATSTMKPGDILTSTDVIPKLPVKPVPGNAYPLGALPVGTEFCIHEMVPGEGMIHAKDGAKTARILKKSAGFVRIKAISGHPFVISEKCMAVVGRIAIHPLKSAPIGTPNRLRWLGNRPRSGLWKRKYAGRKIRNPPPPRFIRPEPLPEDPQEHKLLIHADSEGKRGALRGNKRPFDLSKW